MPRSARFGSPQWLNLIFNLPFILQPLNAEFAWCFNHFHFFLFLFKGIVNIWYRMVL